MMDDDFDIHEERFSQGEKDFENALRPLSFSDFSGQKKIVANRLTTHYYTVLQDWVRLPFRISLPMNWV